MLVLFLLLYSSFEVPYSMAFDDTNADTDKQSPLYAFDVCLDIIFMVDVAMSFVTGFYNTKGIMVKDPSVIAVRYLRSWFLPDVGGSFPFDQVISLFLSQSGNIGALRILKLVRLMKLLRAVRVFKILNELGQREGLGALKNVIGIFRSLFALVFVAHVTGCLFAMLIPDETNDNWMYAYQPDLKFAGAWIRYEVSLYWAIVSITTIGYGDIKPVVDNERIFCIFVAMTGAIVFSFCMGTISELILNVTGTQLRFSIKEQQIRDYIHFRELSKHLGLRIISFYSLSWKKSGALYKEQEILNELSSPLRKAIMIDVGAKAKAQLPILQGFDDESVGYVFTRLRRVDFMAGDVIYQRGDRADEAYLVSSGSVALHLDGKVRSKSISEDLSNATDRRAIRLLDHASDGSMFGELGLFPDISLPVRSETAVAKTNVAAYALSAAEMPSLAELYPNVVATLREYCELKAAEARAMGRAYTEADKTMTRSGGPCRVKTAITQMQRHLLVLKEQSTLVPAASKAGGKVLKLFVTSGSCGGIEAELTSLSCVVSDEGELLCIENTTEGILGAGAKSLGYLWPGRSTYRVLQSEEVRKHVGRAAGGGAQLFGCSISVFCEGFNVQCDKEFCADVQILLFTWVEEEFDTFVQLIETVIHENFTS